MGFLERSVTVNFNNQTSRTLYKTGGWQDDDSAYSSTPPPGTIEPWQSVQWKNAESVLVNTKGYVAYKFSRIDNGQDGHVHVGWSDPISSGNTYDISCDPSPLYGIMYTGGRGTSTTIDVFFVERDLSLYYDGIYSLDKGSLLSANLDASTTGMVLLNQSGNFHIPDSQQSWTFFDSTGSYSILPPFQVGQVFKIKSGKTQRWLTAFNHENNRVGLYPPHYATYSDQQWEVTHAAPDESTDKAQFIALCNVNCRLNLTAAPHGETPFVSAPGGEYQHWRVTLK